MRYLTTFLLLFSFAARGELIYLDMNNAGEEIKACQAGIEAKNAKKLWQEPEQLHVVKGVAGESNFKSKTYYALRAKIMDMINRNIKIDGIVISGEHGDGHFFGSQGDFYQRELVALTKEFPEVGKSLKTAALWGCYPTSVHGAEQYWVNKLPNMQFTMGFVTQGPDKTREANHVLLKQFCERREEAAEATTLDQLCKFYDSLHQVVPTSLGLCNRAGIASKEYAQGPNGEKCLTYKQLHDRCPAFINNPALEGVYERYMSGESEPPAEVPGRVSELRNFHNEAQKWRQCAAKYKAQRGTDMPFPPDLIRLIKYKKIKENLARINAQELAEYDSALERRGLGALKLGDITKTSRKSMNQKIEAAMKALEGEDVEVPVASPPRPAANRSRPPCVGAGFLFSDCDDSAGAGRASEAAPSRRIVRAVSEDPTLLRMAHCMKETFISMNGECSAFDVVSGHARTQSPCLMKYERAREKNEDDAC